MAGLEAGTEIEVTARLRFRHLPPYFIRELEAEQDDLGDVVPEGARIDADELLEQMVVSEVAVARSGDGEVTACTGPQNEAGRSVFACLPDGSRPVGEASAGEARPTGLLAGHPDGGWLLLSGVLPFAVKRRCRGARRPSRRHRGPR